MAQIVGNNAVIRSPGTVGRLAGIFDAYAGGYGTSPEANVITAEQWDQVNAARMMVCQSLSGVATMAPPYIDPSDGIGKWELNCLDVWKVQNPTRDQFDAIVLLNTLSIAGQIAQGDVPAPPARLAIDPAAMGLGPAAAVVLVIVGVAGVAGLSYALSQYAPVADRFLQRQADLAQLRELDGHALNLTTQAMKFAADHPNVPNPMAQESRTAIDRLAVHQAELIRNRPQLAAPPVSLDPSKIAGEMFSGPWPWIILAAGAVGVYLIAKD